MGALTIPEALAAHDAVKTWVLAAREVTEGSRWRARAGLAALGGVLDALATATPVRPDRPTVQHAREAEELADQFAEALFAGEGDAAVRCLLQEACRTLRRGIWGLAGPVEAVSTARAGGEA